MHEAIQGDDEQKRAKEDFIDAHYLNRRKSCSCKCCGGDDSDKIKRMDKHAMDMIKVGI